MEREESDLYGLPLDEFIPKRTELEKRLRKEGERERATAVKRLTKPSVAAWAVNQASRCRPKERRALLAASEDLREVQERLLSGDASAADLERATSAQREALDGLVEAAAGLLTSEGKSMGDATLARVRETFAAVATDPELAELIEAGTLDRERQATGLGFAFGGAGAEAEPSGGPAKGGGAKAKGGGSSSGKAGSAKDRGSAGPKVIGGKAASAKREAAARKRAEQAAREARERVKRAKKDEREAARRLEAARRAAEKAAADLEKRERQVEEARERAESARAELEAAGEAHADAGREREEAESAAAHDGRS